MGFRDRCFSSLLFVHFEMGSHLAQAGLKLTRYKTALNSWYLPHDPVAGVILPALNSTVVLSSLSSIACFSVTQDTVHS